MLFLLLILAPLARAESCPNISGTFSDRGLFQEKIQQTGCDKITWKSSVHPQNPNPPGPPYDEPSVYEWVIDCQKHPSLYDMVANCWIRGVLENWTYSKNIYGKWVPFSIRRIYLDEKGNLHDDAYLTDSTGDERKYLESTYTREAR